MEGACDGTCGCSTCHVILEEPLFNALPEALTDESDLLDSINNSTKTSRLGCQLLITEKFNKAKIKLPDEVENVLDQGDRIRF
mmetsp:Transcript_11867/g.1785  ORF Transcript_11867/g.1785 Transcript_11867/m.1785 type:complete len:83 (+) Transcript_11867:125-373(+)